MPFEGVDPWRRQYFDGVVCPPGVVIPIDDATAWRLYPRYRAVYDKLVVCASQGIPSGPHGVMPARYPVFSKPIMNLKGMGVGGRIIHAASDLEAHCVPGHMWMRLLRGRHISTDVALVDGRPRWWRHTIGRALSGGMFDYWTVLAGRLPRLEKYGRAWMRKTLPDFTGIVNLETIRGSIIECHLRMSEQWVDINGPGWLESAVDLYAHGRWRFAHRPRVGYSIALFGPHGRRYSVAPDAVDTLRTQPGISSIQITFDPEKPPGSYAMPPGGFRLALVNCWDLASGLAVRERLKRLFTEVSLDGEGAMGGSVAASERSGPLREDGGGLGSGRPKGR
jgi:hypothetical protein